MTLILFSHTYFENSKINKALLEEASKLENLEISNLNLLYKDYKIDIQKEQEKLEKADKIIVQFPMFWYSTPSIFKEWQDAVLTPLYVEKSKIIADKKLGFIISAGGSREDFLEYESKEFSAIDRILFPLVISFESLSVKICKSLAFYNASSSKFDLQTCKKQYLDYIKEF